MNSDSLPLGLGMALAQRPDAMECFCSMTEQQQAEIIEQAHHVASRKEMKSLVSKLVSDSSQ